MTLSPDQLHVIRAYFRLPPEPGGMERHIAALTAAQRRLGVRVTLVYNSGQAEGDAVRLWGGRDFLPIRPAALRDLLFYGSAMARSAQIPTGGIRVMHAHGDWSAFACARVLGRVLGAKAIAATYHGSMKPPPAIYRHALKGCLPVFATGLRETHTLQRATGKPVIHLPSAPAELFFGPPAPSSAPECDVISVGSLIPCKNLDLLLQCATRRRRLSFAVYGDGPERQRLEVIKTREQLTNVDFRGMAAPEEVHAGLTRARVFVSTSTEEGSPTSALEAMACGLPVVLTPSNDYSRIVREGVNGKITSGWEAEELVAAIDEFIGAGSRVRTAAENSRAIAQEHRWGEKARRVTDAMLAAVAGKMESK